jgi:hypothetical protein
MRKIWAISLLCFLLFVTINSYSQEPTVFRGSGECWEILADINQQVKNDSLTVEYFKVYYEIESSFDKDKVWKLNFSQFILFFQERKTIKCYFKRRSNKYYPVLLDDFNE